MPVATLRELFALALLSICSSTHLYLFPGLPVVCVGVCCVRRDMTSAWFVAVLVGFLGGGGGGIVGLYPRCA